MYICIRIVYIEWLKRIYLLNGCAAILRGAEFALSKSSRSIQRDFCQYVNYILNGNIFVNRHALRIQKAKNCINCINERDKAIKFRK